MMPVLWESKKKESANTALQFNKKKYDIDE